MKLNKTTKIIKEAVEDNLPRPLPRDQVLKYIEDVKPGIFFNLGYVRELGKADIASKFRGGRGAVADETGTMPSFIRIFKCSELYGCTGVDYESKQATVDMRANTGKERVGNKYQVDMVIPNKVMKTAYGDLLQFFPREGTYPKVKWFISRDNAIAIPATKEEVSDYLTPAAANKLLNPVEKDKTVSGATVMRFNIDKIYRIGNLGSTIMIGEELDGNKENNVKEEKKVCPKCGKEVCECKKGLNESDEIVTTKPIPCAGGLVIPDELKGVVEIVSSDNKEPNIPVIVLKGPKDAIRSLFVSKADDKEGGYDDSDLFESKITEASKTPEEKAAEAQAEVEERRNTLISIVTDLITRKFSDVDSLKGDIASLKENGAPKAVTDIFESILDDITIHIGMGQKALSIVSPKIDQAIKSGEEKASAVASEPANDLK